MGDLRIKYESHGFDEDEKSINSFAKAAKSLAEFAKEFPNKFAKSQAENKKETKLPKVNIDPNIVKATLGTLGPIGYLLSQTLNLGSGISKVLSKGKTSTTTTEARDNIATPKGFIDTLEDSPTIKKLNAYIDAKISMDERLNNAYDAVVAFSEMGYNADIKQHEESKKSTNAMQKTFNSMSSNLKSIKDFQSAQVAMVGLGVVGLLSLGLWLKQVWNRRFGSLVNTNASENITQFQGGFKGDFKSGNWANNLVQTGSFGEKRSTGRTHKGMDIAIQGGDISGAPVRSLCDGTAETLMETVESGTIPFFKSDRNGAMELKGYGLIVRVHVTPQVKEHLGYPHAKSCYVQYSHLQDILVDNGAKVKKGNIIGRVGRTGSAVSSSTKNMKSHLDISLWVDGVPKNIDEATFENKLGAYVTTFEAFKSLSSIPVTEKGASDYMLENYAPYTSVSSKANQQIHEKGGAVTENTRSGLVMTRTGTFIDRNTGRIYDSSGMPIGTVSDTTSTTDTLTRTVIPNRVNTPDNATNDTPPRVSTIGKNNAIMGTNNLLYEDSRSNKKESNTTQEQPRVAVAPSVIQNGSKEPTYTMSFDTQNDATKMLKHSNKVIDFVRFS